MNGKERVIAAFERREVDRPPFFPVVTQYLGSRVLRRSMTEMALDPQLLYDGLRGMVERFGFDGVEVSMGPPRGSMDGIEVREQGRKRYLADRETGRLLSELQEDDAPLPLDQSPMLLDKADLDKIEVTPAEEYERLGCVEPVRRLVADTGDRVFLAGHAAGQTMNTLVAWRGSDQAMYDLVDDPEFVLAAMERATDISIELGKALIRAGVPGIYIGDAWASASIISPQTYERFCLPYHRKAAQAFQALGAKVYLHICGNATPILEMMADTGVDGIEPLDPMGGVRVDDAKRRVGDRVALKGGVSTLLLLNGTPDEVREASRRAIREGGPTGYILGSGDDIPRDAPFANIDAMRQAAEEG